MALAQFKPSQVLEALVAAIKARLNILIVGQPGIGKTALVALAARMVGALIILSHPATEDPTDIKGFPCILNGQACFVPFGQLKAAIEASTLTVWFLDDLGQATPAMQSAYMQVIWGGRIGSHTISDKVTFVAATNDRKHKANVQPMIEPLKSRFTSTFEMVADFEEWRPWAIENGFSPILLAFLKARPDLFSAFSPTADFDGSPTPRTWEHFASILQWDLTPATRKGLLEGAVGQGAAGEFLTFERMYGSLVEVDALLKNGNHGTLPTNQPDRLWAIACAMAHRVDAKSMPNLGIVANRLFDAGCGEYATLLVRDTVRRHPELQETATYAKLVTGEYGKYLSGQAA